MNKELLHILFHAVICVVELSHPVVLASYLEETWVSYRWRSDIVSCIKFPYGILGRK